MNTGLPSYRRRFVRGRGFQKCLGAFVCVLALTVTGTTLADRVELKTGEVFFGDILRANEREVSIRLKSGGVLSFRRKKVHYFRRNFVVSEEWKPDWNTDIDDPLADEHTPYPGYFDLPEDTPASIFDLPNQIESPESPPADLPQVPINPNLVEDSVQDATNGFELAPPKGFLTWPNDNELATVAFYQDPVTQANLNILAYPTGESIEVIKKRAARSYSEQVSNFKVVRDEPLRTISHEGWLFEVKSQLVGQAIHQLQVFMSNKEKVFVLTYSTSEENFPMLVRSFEESVRSFRFSEVKKETPEEVEITTPNEDPLETPVEDDANAASGQTDEKPAVADGPANRASKDVEVIISPEEGSGDALDESANNTLDDIERALKELQELEEES